MMWNERFIIGDCVCALYSFLADRPATADAAAAAG